MKKLLFFSVFAMFFSFAYAQEAVIEFKQTEYDFGTIKEEDGSVTTTFVFTNTGNAPLIVSGVSASCGCTTPDWSKEPIAPGATGFVKASYNTAGRPGPFRKSITVRSNATEAAITLFIAGDVIPKPKVEDNN